MVFVDFGYSHFELLEGFDFLPDIAAFSEKILLGNFES